MEQNFAVRNIRRPHKGDRMNTKELRLITVLFVVSSMVLSACGGGGGGGGTDPCSGPTANVAYNWTCTTCSNPGALDVITQSGASISGYIMLCSGNGSCPSFCIVGANNENSFTGAVSGSCISVRSNDGTWSASGRVTGNSMQITVTSTSANCFGAQTQTASLGH
jgi:predicted small secreted protein